MKIIGMFAITALMIGNVVQSETPNMDQFLANATDISLADRPDVQLIVTLTFLVGCVMVIMAVLHIHLFASYLSDSLISGFTTAAAIHVVLSQVPPLLGLKDVEERSGFLKIYFVSWTTFYMQPGVF